MRPMPELQQRRDDVPEDENPRRRTWSGSGTLPPTDQRMQPTPRDDRPASTYAEPTFVPLQLENEREELAWVQFASAASTTCFLQADAAASDSAKRADALVRELRKRKARSCDP